MTSNAGEVVCDVAERKVRMRERLNRRLDWEAFKRKKGVVTVMKKSWKIALGLSAAFCMTTASVGVSQAATMPPFTTITVINTGEPLNPFNSNYFQPEGMVMMPLAWTKNTSNINAFWPSLAAKWKVSDGGKELTIWLQPKAKWSNGKPVTATDVYDSFAALAEAGKDSYELADVKIVNPHEVLFVRGSTPFNMFENQVLQQVVVPAQTYGRFVPAGIWKIIAESEYIGPNKKLQKLAQVQTSKLATLGDALEKYQTPVAAGELSDGPFVITGFNAGEVTAKKNPLYWDAKIIKVQQALLYNDTGNQSVWAMMMGAKTDQATSAMPQNVEQEGSRTPGNHFFAIATYSPSGLLFDEHDYPYNMVKVRQALAYMINRVDASLVEMPYTPPKDIPLVDGMGNGTMNAYLSPKQVKSLNPYSFNLSKGAALLKSAGMKQGPNGQWMLSNGQPWKMTLYVPAGYSDWIQGAAFISHELTSEGIQTTSDVVNDTAFAQQQETGKYPVSFLFANGGPNAYLAYDSFFGAADGFNLEADGSLQHTFSTAQFNYIQSPVTYHLKGIGTINPGVMTLQLSQTQNSAVIQKDAYDLATLVNQQVPFIPTEDELVNGFVNAKTYTDYPLNNALVLNSQYYFAPFEWMDLGFVHPAG